MREALRGFVAGVVVLALLGAIASRAGWIATELPRPHGTGAWRWSRVTGLTAFVALGLDVIVGLAVSTRAADRWIPRGQIIDLHGWLSPLVVALVAGHAVLLLGDRYIGFDLLDVAVPFASAYRPVAVGLGVLAAYLAVAVHVSFRLRRRIGPKVWRRVHYASFAALATAALHVILAGSDAGRAGAVWLYATPLVIAAALVARRVRAARHARAQCGAGTGTGARSR